MSKEQLEAIEVTSIASAEERKHVGPMLGSKLWGLEGTASSPAKLTSLAYDSVSKKVPSLANNQGIHSLTYCPELHSRSLLRLYDY